MKKLPQVANPDLMPLRWRVLGDQVLVTNDAGRFVLLSQAAFGDLMGGSLSAQSPEWSQLVEAGFIKQPGVEERVIADVRQRSGHLFVGPSLHIVILTLRCNQHCVYCHANRKSDKAVGYDMDLQTAAKVLDVIFDSPAPELTIEFQGGEPALNFDVLRYFVDEGQRRAAEQGRQVYYSLVSNLSPLNQEQIDYLVDRGVMACTSIDGPAALHDRNRRFGGVSAHAAAVDAIARFADAYRGRGLDPELAYVNALVTVSRRALSQPEAIVDEYVRMGHKVVHLRPLNPFGMGHKVWAEEGYTADEFLAFWRSAVDHIIALNLDGVEMMEKMASLMLTRILTDRDPNYMDLRSPCGAGIGQLAYNYDGRVYTCDEGRMVGAMGDDMFCIGDVRTDDYAAIIHHPGVKSLCVASCLECLPGCADCAHAPYCGVCPVYNYVLEGDLVARAPSNDRCRIQMGMLDHLFGLIQRPELADILHKWTETRDRGGVYRRFVPLDTGDCESLE